ncbi:unnamed protein product [Parascedosporium putredinis]|uniref:Uncharacterized protein n=1 Tax=Parascedosporium putredinis TaxID=1442378 RepID=A0A9P1HD12_9PEZI|nr:unnamed protein product [Parascedosporium putredinis]CAI8003551.1 unnamed protein product [Parascedosporium putredinis]
MATQETTPISDERFWVPEYFSILEHLWISILKHLFRGSFTRRQAPRPVEKPTPPTAAAQSPHALAIKSTERDHVNLNHFLLSATPEREIVSELSSIRNLLEAHVEEHYHLQPVRCDVALLTNAVSNLGLGRQGSLSPAEATSLALNPQTRYATLRHILSEVIFSSASLHGQCPISILPAPMAMFAQSIPPVESKLGNAEGRLQQVEHLKAVILEIAKLGYIILSQPSEWEFSHREDLRGQGTFVFSPGLAKTRDREGRAYQPLRTSRMPL